MTIRLSVTTSDSKGIILRFPEEIELYKMVLLHLFKHGCKPDMIQYEVMHT